ncbi:hypothetical protein ElyMa_000908300 [Elysia marginata]|uniref:G-protein coupled receptors family 1 profile domain-containing protein n=1 Tax=Elysia marginata TaxID=1093978 RepID=A0AAV4HA93_9GAST|nr:hypothetical protein ElyMa_000908300 [Elysia marginata]
MLMSAHLINNGILLLSLNLVASTIDGNSCYFKSLGTYLGFILTYISALVLAVFNFAAVFYPHVFYKREMLTPAGFAILASWIVGLLVSVLAVGFDTPTQTKCYFITTMPRYGILTLSLTCLLCTVIIVVLNVRMFLYFRTFRIHSYIPPNKYTNQLKRDSTQAFKDSIAKRDKSKTRQNPLTLASEILPYDDNDFVLTHFNDLRVISKQREHNRRSSETATNGSLSTGSNGGKPLDIFAVKVDFQAEGCLPGSTSCQISTGAQSSQTRSGLLDSPSQLTEIPKISPAISTDYLEPSCQHQHQHNAPSWMSNISSCLPLRPYKMKQIKEKDAEQLSEGSPQIKRKMQPFTKNKRIPSSTSLDASCSLQIHNKVHPLIKPMKEIDTLSSPHSHGTIQPDGENESAISLQHHNIAQSMTHTESPCPQQRYKNAKTLRKNENFGSLQRKDTFHPVSTDMSHYLTRNHSRSHSSARDESSRSTQLNSTVQRSRKTTRDASSRSTQLNSTVQRSRKTTRDKTIMMTLVMLTFYTCCMNLSFTISLLWAASLNSYEAKLELIESQCGKISIILILLHAVLNPYFYMFRLVTFNDIKTVLEQALTRRPVCCKV